MILAKVTGFVVATQKCEELKGGNLLLVSVIDADQQPIKDRTYVAIDCVGAGKGDIVLVEKYYPANKESKNRVMSIIAIVEHVQRDN